VQIEIAFPGGARVDARFGPFNVSTDQPPKAGGEGTAPTPFNLFLVSIGTCAGIFVLNFLRSRDIPSDGVHIFQHVESNPETGMVDEIEIEIQLPPDFPDKYREAIIRTVELCSVKKHIDQPPRFVITTKTIPALVA
jgi:ribosomal protein S12 methylthiotransferase accessory factor